VDLCVTSAEEARAVFGLGVPGPILPSAETRRRPRPSCRALSVSRAWRSPCAQAASAETTDWSAMLYTRGEAVILAPGIRFAIVDRLGAGRQLLRRSDLLPAARAMRPARAIEFRRSPRGLPQAHHRGRLQPREPGRSGSACGRARAGRAGAAVGVFPLELRAAMERQRSPAHGKRSALHSVRRKEQCRQASSPAR